MALTKLILSMFIWGTLGFFVLKTDLSAIDIAFFRCVIGALILAPYCWCKGMFRLQFTVASLLPVVVGGVFVVFNWVLLFLSFRYASITLGNVSYYVQPVFLLVLGCAFFKENIEPLKLIFILLTLWGVYLTIDLSQQGSHVGDAQVLGVGCALLAGLFYSIATLIVKTYRGLPSPMMTLVQFVSGGIVLCPFMSFDQISFNPSLLLNLAIIGGLHTVVAFVFYYESVPLLSTDVIAIVSYIDPIVAILSDVMFFNRHLSISQMTGIILTLLGSYCVIQITWIKRCLRRLL